MYTAASKTMKTGYVSRKRELLSIFSGLVRFIPQKKCVLVQRGFKRCCVWLRTKFFQSNFSYTPYKPSSDRSKIEII